MRCRNCGWENDLGALKCDKCNAPLNGSMVDDRQHSRREDEHSEPILNNNCIRIWRRRVLVRNV